MSHFSQSILWHYWLTFCHLFRKHILNALNVAGYTSQSAFDVQYEVPATDGKLSRIRRIFATCLRNKKTLTSFFSLLLWSRCRTWIWRFGRWPKRWGASFHSDSKTNRGSPRKQRHPETRTDVVRSVVRTAGRASSAGSALAEHEGQHSAQCIAESSRTAHHQHLVGDNLALPGASVRVGAAAGGDPAGVCARVAAAPAGDGAGSQRVHGRSRRAHTRQTERAAGVIATKRQTETPSCTDDCRHGLRVGLHRWLLYCLIVPNRFTVVLF